MKGTDPAVDKLRAEIGSAMRRIGDIVGSDFNDLDITVDENGNVTGLVVSVYHKRNFEYGVCLPIALATRLTPEAIAGYFYGSGAAQYEAERDPQYVGGIDAVEVWAQQSYEVREGDQRIGLVIRNGHDRFDGFAGTTSMVYVGQYAQLWEAVEKIQTKHRQGC